MAGNPSVQWPTRTTAAAPAYPYGSSKDETTPGANDGTPYEKARADDIFGLQQALLKFAGIVPSGTADTAQTSQYLEAILDVALGGGFFEDGGAADSYLFDVLSGTDRQGPSVYTDGMEVSAVIANTNTGASTVNVNSIGVKNIFYKGGALTAGLLTAGDTVLLKYDDGNNRFNLIESDRLFVDLATAQILSNKSLVDSLTFLIDNSDPTKKIQFELSPVATGTTRVWSFPNFGDTFAGVGSAQTLNNKTLGTGTNIALGSDANGDIYIRSGGTLIRLPAGTDEDVLRIKSGLPSWETEPLTKIMDIGDWDMIASGSVSVAHGLTASKIRSITASIRNDADNLTLMLPTYASAGVGAENAGWDSTNVVLNRAVSGAFNSTNYDSTSYNRGWIVIQYVP